MGLLKEFKDFAFKGNVMDMSVGVIIGGAFTAVVSGVTDNTLNPIVQLILKHTPEELEAWEKALPTYVGSLVSAIVTFLLTALVLFLIIKGINTAGAKASALASRGKEDEPAAPTTMAE